VVYPGSKVDAVLCICTCLMPGWQLVLLHRSALCCYLVHGQPLLLYVHCRPSQVAAELSDCLKVLFNQGKYGPLIRFLQGASEALGMASTTAAESSSGPAAGAGSGAVSAAEAARKEAELLLWGANRLNVASWLVAALDKVEGQFRGVGLALLMERCVIWWLVAEDAVCI
jgi:hypothetical protein